MAKLGTERLIQKLAAGAGTKRGISMWVRIWRWVSGRRQPPEEGARAVYFGEAGRPRDLDDPFSDPGVQMRIGGELAKRARRRRRGPAVGRGKG